MNEVLTTAELTAKLAELGYSLETKLSKDNGMGKQADWQVTLKLRSSEFTTEFHNGQRRWADKPGWYRYSDYRDYVAKYYRAGKLVTTTPKNTIAMQEFYKALTVPLEPSLTDVLYCLVSDAECVRHGQSFEDFCSELGYNPDSISHLKIYNACTDIWRALVRMGVDFSELQKLMQNY